MNVIIIHKYFIATYKKRYDVVNIFHTYAH